MEQRERPCSQVNEAGEAQTGGVGRGQLKVTCLWLSVTGTRQMSEEWQERAGRRGQAEIRARCAGDSETPHRRRPLLERFFFF